MYYTIETCAKIFNSIENPKMRRWKIIDEDGKCYDNHFTISSPDKLFKFIHQSKNPKALYVGTSTFVNAKTNHGFFAKQKQTFKDGYSYPREGYIMADCILVNCYFFIDLDSEKDLRIAQDEARKIIRALKDNKDLCLHSIQFSGSKGVHLIYKHNITSIADPIQRIKDYQEKKKEIITNLIQSLNLTLIDKNHIGVISNPFGVYSAPYSIKSNGRIVTPIHEQEFMNKDIYLIINSSKQEGLMPLVSEAKTILTNSNLADDDEVVVNNTRGRGRANLSTYPQYYGLITNVVPGLRQNYVPFIKIHKKRLKHIDFNDLLNDLSNMIIFEDGNYYWINSTKVFQKPKLLKIMRRLKAVNISEFHRRYSKFRFTNVLDKDKKEICRPPKPIFIKSIKNDYVHSRAHANFFKEFGIIDNLIGRDNLKTYKAKVMT